MRRIIPTITILAVLFAALVLPPAANAANAGKAKRDGKPATVHAILISASNKKGAVDQKIAAYDADLRRNLRMESFRFVGEGTVTLPNGGHATISLPNGQRLELEDDPDTGIRLKVFWMVGSEVVIRTTLTLNAGIPGVLARRPANDGDVPVVLLIAR